MKIIIKNSRIKPKSKTMLEVITNLVLDFNLCFGTAYMTKYCIDVTSIQGKTKTILHITWRSKKYFRETIYNSNYTHKIFKITAIRNTSTYNVNTNCNLLYALKLWNYFSTISKRRLNFWAKLLFIKLRCLINVHWICGLLRNGWRTTKCVRCDMSALNVSFIFL